MSSWHGYPKIFSAGHAAVRDLLNYDVNLEEKIDGSQFSFGVFPALMQDGTAETRYLKIRSKGAEIYPDAPPKMFQRAVDYVKSVQHLLHPGWTYRGEALDKPGYNALVYDRVPKNHIIVFDVNTDEEAYLSHEDKFREADRIGLECVPLFYQGRIDSLDQFRQFLDQTSCLGGQKIEGVVIKPVVPVFGRDKKALMMKFVSEAYKEVHAKTWGDANPTSGDILEQITQRLQTPARWNKAIQHLRDADQLEDSPRDIGKLIKAIPEDVRAECGDDIKAWLWAWAWPHISRGIVRGMPSYYKDTLLRLQFERDPEGVGEATAYRVERAERFLGHPDAITGVSEERMQGDGYRGDSDAVSNRD